MEKQKVIVAILRLKNSENDSRLVPFCFKVEENQLPSDLQPLEIHPNNMIEANIPGCKPFQAMIVSTGDDSKELFECYSTFIANCKEKKISNLDHKINNWLNVEGIKITRVNCKGLPSTPEEDFEILMSKIRTIRTRSKSAVSTSSKADVAVIDLADQPSQEDKSATESESHSSLKKLKEFNKNILTQDQIQKVFAEIIKILESVVQSSTKFQDSGEVETIPYEPASVFSEVRLIPEKDKTTQVENTTMIEGILPISTKKYKKAISMGNSKGHSESDFEPSVILTNLVRYAFPKHWLIGVTLRGSGGKKSLISVWNYRNPLVDPCLGAFENGLGESRLRALIDHVIRKSKKQSYDKATEKLLINNLSKALHYARTKVAPVKVKSPSHSMFESDESDKDRDESDDDGSESDTGEHPQIPLSHINLSIVKKEKFSDDDNSQGFRYKSAASTSRDSNTLDLSDFYDADVESTSTVSGISRPKEFQSSFSEKNTIPEEPSINDQEVEENPLLHYENFDETPETTSMQQGSTAHEEPESSDVNNEVNDGNLSESSTLANSTKDSGIDESGVGFKTSTPKRLSDIPSSQVLKKTRIEKISDEKDSSSSGGDSTSSTSTALTEAQIQNIIGSLPDKDLAAKVAASLRKQIKKFNSKTVKQFSSQPQTSKSSEKKKSSSQPIHGSIAGPSTSSSTKKSSDSGSRPTSLQTKLQNGYKYGLILPNIYDENLCQIKQPFLAQICEFELLEFGFDIPFNDFLNDRNNYFSIEIGKQKLYAQLIAIADSPSDLQECLRRNLELNTKWKDLRKIIGNVNKVMHLIHAPLSESDDFPIKHVLSDKILCSLIKDFTSNEETQPKKIDSERISSTKKKSQVKANVDEIQRQQSVTETDQIQGTERDKSDTKIEVLKMKLDALNQKKNFLLDSDILSSTLKATIEAVSSVFSLVVKEKESCIITMNVPVKDETYKIKKKIFIEGMIQFDLDKYQFATTKVKQRNACALAYQLVHRVFPTVYWKNVTLGKKFYDQDEIKSFSDQIKESKKLTKKVPLCFVWGFKDPYNEPYQGDLDIIRGQERVRALIGNEKDLEKCEKLTYVEEEEAKVRERLIKELCMKNSPDKSEKRKSSKSTDLVEFSDDSNQSDDDARNHEREQDDAESIPGEDDTQSAFSDIWNSELFS
uniref:Uncharacterized protein n=1 Tax=Tetranychus urticae TaxID=32264 RepID=T1KLI1_TETUR